MEGAIFAYPVPDTNERGDLLTKSMLLGSADAGALVDTILLREENRTYLSFIRTIALSEPIPNHVLAARGTLDRIFLQVLSGNLYSLADNASGESLLHKAGLTGFIDPILVDFSGLALYLSRPDVFNDPAE